MASDWVVLGALGVGAYLLLRPQDTTTSDSPEPGGILPAGGGAGNYTASPDYSQPGQGQNMNNAPPPNDGLKPSAPSSPTMSKGADWTALLKKPGLTQQQASNLATKFGYDGGQWTKGGDWTAQYNKSNLTAQQKANLAAKFGYDSPPGTTSAPSAAQRGATTGATAGGPRTPPNQLSAGLTTVQPRYQVALPALRSTFPRWFR